MRASAYNSIVKRFYLDTNVYRSANEERHGLCARQLLAAHSRIRVPQPAALELIEDMCTCQPEKFADRREDLRLAYRLADHGRLLRAPGEFMALRVFRTSFSNPIVTPAEVLRWMRVAIAYRAKEHFGEFIRVSEIDPRDWRLDPEKVAGPLREMRSRHIQMIDSFRARLLGDVFGSTDKISRDTQVDQASAALIDKYYRSETWKHTFMVIKARDVGASVTKKQALEWYPLLQAPAEFLGTILNQALTQRYKYWRKGNDAIDYNLLVYLCDPNLVFVTDDQKLRSKLRSPTSANRVISSEKLASELSGALPHTGAGSH